MKRQIVIAKYKEDVGWAKNYPEAIIYTKDVDIPNYGRESSTYLHHIIKNYYELADFTIFCQGKPFDHCRDFQSLINDYEHDYKEYGHWNVTSYGNGLPQHAGLRIDAKCKDFFGKTLPRYGFISGAQFVVSKDIIRSRPIAFYEKLLQYCRDDYDAPWVLERLWRLVFDPKNHEVVM